MHVLILSANMGGGHNAAGQALAHALERRGAQAQIVDGLGLASPWWARQTEQLYYKTIRRTPKLYNATFRTVERLSSPYVRSLPYVLSNINLQKVTRYILESRPDAVLATHVFCAQMLTHLTKHCIISQYTAGIVTDYGYTPYWNETRLDDYFLAHAEQVGMYAAHGMDKARLHPTGIPIMPPAGHGVAEAKRKLGLEPGRKHAVIAGGAIGLGNLPEIVSALDGRLPAEVLLSVVCAGNDAGRGMLAERYGSASRVRVLGYVKPLSDLIAAADLVVSKAGGLTSTEVFAHRIPYITLYSLPPIETGNEALFATHGVAYTAKNAADAAGAALRLLYDAQAANDMARAQAEFVPENAAGAIADHVLRALAGS